MPDKKKIQIIHAQLAALGKARSAAVSAEEKQQLVLQFTGSRETSTTGMTNAEADALISHLNQFTQPVSEKAERQRRHIIAMAHEMGWELGNGKADMPRINEWCVNLGFGKKPLNDYTERELPALVTQFKKVYEWYLKAI